MYVKTNWVDNTTPIDKNNLNKIESGIKNNDINIGEENYDNTKTYEVGDIVRYNEKIYKCITAITTAENFDSSKWEQTNIVEIVQSEKSKIYELIEAISTPIVGEGENITLNDTAEKRFENFDIEGNSEQETRSGKNLYKASSIWYKNINGMNITVSDRTENSCVLTSSGRSFTLFASDQPGGSSEYRTKVEPNTEYTLSINAELLNGTSGIGLYVFFDKDSSSDYFNLKSIDYSKKITFTTPADTNYIHFRIDIYNASTSYKISNIQIEKGSEATSYEPYGASPSPDYPSEVESCGDNGSINVVICNKNIFDGKLETGEYDVLGNKISNSGRYRNVNKITIEENETYFFSIDGVGKNYVLFFYDKNGNFLTTGNTDNYKVKTPSHAKYMNFRCFVADYVADYSNLKIQIEKNTIVTSYEQHQEQSYTIPVQQPMLEEDYFDWDNEEEVHIWNKLVLNTVNTTDFGIAGEFSGDYIGIYMRQAKIDTLNIKQGSKLLSNNLKQFEKGTNVEGMFISGTGDYTDKMICIGVKRSRLATEDIAGLNTYFSENPIEIYYQSTVKTRLPFTDEQKAVAKKLNNARTYKGVTHIYSNDAVSPNCYVEAVKDLTTLIQ